MTTSILSFFHTGLFRKFNFLVSQLKHLTLKTTSLGIYKMRAGIFYGDIYRKLDLIFESLLDFQSFFMHFMSFINYRKSKQIFK